MAMPTANHVAIETRCGRLRERDCRGKKKPARATGCRGTNNDQTDRALLMPSEPRPADTAGAMDSRRLFQANSIIVTTVTQPSATIALRPRPRSTEMRLRYKAVASFSNSRMRLGNSPRGSESIHSPASVSWRPRNQSGGSMEGLGAPGSSRERATLEDQAGNRRNAVTHNRTRDGRAIIEIRLNATDPTSA